MFDLGWTELLVIGIVALVIIGPKDLPIMFRRVGQFVGKAKGMAREFSRAMDQAADEAGVKDVTNTLNTVTNPIKANLQSVSNAAEEFKRWSPDEANTIRSAKRADVAEKIDAANVEKLSETKVAANTSLETANVETSDTIGTATGGAPHLNPADTETKN